MRLYLNFLIRLTLVAETRETWLRLDEYRSVSLLQIVYCAVE